jgi:predicted RNA-binding protein with RPS1 domain
MTLEIGVTVSGKIVDIPPEGVLVSLSDNQIGLVPVCESLPSEALKVRFHIGEQVTVRIVGRKEDGRFNLSILPPKEAGPTDAFDREFHRLNHVLRSRPPKKLTLEHTHREPTVEESIKEWTSQADQTINRLRRHRTKRLRETFYDDESDGGRHAKRNRHHR